MTSTHTSLDNAATERKARLAQLKSLKRKQPTTDAGESEDPRDAAEASAQEPETVASKFLSGRNFDLETRGPKLGFENAPIEGRETVETTAKSIADATAKQAEEEEKADKPIDLFSLQPKKPNWDLKRDLERKLEILNVQTDNAIARIVRERIENQRKKRLADEKGAGLQTANGKAKSNGDSEDENGEEIGLQGEELLKGVHQREREEAEDERREQEEDDLT